MMQFDCTDIKAMLSAIVDGQLDRDQRHHVERHLTNCKPCRRLLDEAEAVDAILALDADGAEAASLPKGFEDAVLAQTVHTHRMRLRDRRWVTVGGWVASAAAIALAMTIWIVDRRALLRQPQAPITESATAIDPGAKLSYTSNISNSWIYEGPVESAHDASVGTTSDGVKTSAASTIPGAPPTIERIMQSAAMTREDAESIYAAALALDQLRGADAQSFAELDFVRRIVEYDELLPKLGGAHHRLSADDRAAVLAAESIFTRIVRGPINADDLTEIGETIVTLELPERLTRIARRSDATMSL